MAVTKVTLVDSPEKMRLQKSPSMDYSILMGQNLRISKSIGSEKEEPSKANQKTDNQKNGSPNIGWARYWPLIILRVVQRPVAFGAF